MKRQIILDTETTGLSAQMGDRIIEIGCVELVARKLTGYNKHFYLNPERDSHEDAIKVHGISNEFLRDKPKFAAVADELMAYLEGAELIIHNAPFDVGFLDKELERSGHQALRGFVAEITDTLAMAKSIYPGKRNSLDALCDRLDVDNSGRTLHGALLDASLLAEVYINLTRGQDALLIDGAPSDQATITGHGADLRGFDLLVVYATQDELLAHEELLRQLDKDSRGKTVWRQDLAPSVA